MWFRISLFALLALTPSALQAQTPVPSPAEQMAAAVLPLPSVFRAGAGVRGYTSNLVMVTLREGSNGMVCTADRPGDEVFDVRCYEKDFLKIIDRWREVAAGGLSDTAVDRRLDQEIKDGRLHLPDHPTAGYRMLGPIRDYDARTNVATGVIERWQSIHFPYRTAAELGLPTEQEGTMPFVMASGTWWSHVMIVHTPPE
jgi:hypothetical protein